MTETLSESSIEKLLNETGVTNDDPDLQSYLVSLLSDEDAYDDDGLVETLTSLLEDSDKARLIDEAVSKLRGDSESTSRTPVSFSNASPSTVVSTTTAPLATSTRIGGGKEEDEITAGSPRRTSSEHEEASQQPQKKKQSSRGSDRRRRRKRQSKSASAPVSSSSSSSSDSDHDDFIEDEASAWQACMASGQRWGGRGQGGRGEYAGMVNSIQSNIHLSNVNLSLPNGHELLVHATMDLTRGHRYGLMGRNGSGKSTLLKRLAQKAIPGLPSDMRILLVQQQIDGSDTTSALEVLVQADVDRTRLLEEQQAIETRMEQDETLTQEDLAELAERLGYVVDELAATEADQAEERAIKILKGLQFTDEMIYNPTSRLSGGWRMRLALARALFVPCDLLLLDEVTNHLDLYGIAWLIEYLTKEEPDRTVMVVSHDRAFLDAICTDIVVLEHQRLDYHVGNFSAYERQQQEKAAREAQILDAAERQRTKAQAFVQKQQAEAHKKSADPKKQRQAKMIKEKKLDRIGNYRQDGKRYKLRSLKKLSEESVRLAEKVVIEVDEPVVKMKFPNPDWPPSVAPDTAIVRMDDFSFGYGTDSKPLLDNVTLSLTRGSKVALVGRNGCGKSTLAKLIAGDLQPSADTLWKGELWRHSNLRVGHVTQYSVEELEAYSSETVLEYSERTLRSGKASESIIAKHAGNPRQYLGAFGLGGKNAHQKIGKLSGGERMRLCFAMVLADQPHLLLLDESTNHVDLETLDSMSAALNAFEGAVLMISHNQGFLSGFCKELWVLEDGHMTVNYSETESFDEIFSEYRSSILQKDSKSLSTRRREKAGMAKRATQQRAGARQDTALL